MFACCNTFNSSCRSIDGMCQAPNRLILFQRVRNCSVSGIRGAASGGLAGGINGPTIPQFCHQHWELGIDGGYPNLDLRQVESASGGSQYDHRWNCQHAPLLHPILYDKKILVFFPMQLYQSSLGVSTDVHKGVLGKLQCKLKSRKSRKGMHSTHKTAQISNNISG